MLVTVYLNICSRSIFAFLSCELSSWDCKCTRICVRLFEAFASYPTPRLKLSLVVTFSNKRSRYSPRKAQRVSNIPLLCNKRYLCNLSSPSIVRCCVRFVLNGLTWCGSKLGSGINFKSCPYECSKQKHFWGQAAAKVRKTTAKICVTFNWKKMAVGSILAG